MALPVNLDCQPQLTLNPVLALTDSPCYCCCFCCLTKQIISHSLLLPPPRRILFSPRLYVAVIFILSLNLILDPLCPRMIPSLPPSVH